MKTLQFIAHDDKSGGAFSAIWGTGDTPENAIDAALEMGIDVSDLETCQASPELIALVEENGGDIAWDYQHGIAVPV